MLYLQYRIIYLLLHLINNIKKYEDTVKIEDITNFNSKYRKENLVFFTGIAVLFIAHPDLIL